MGIATAADRGAHRYRALDSLRGLCACMVVLYHVHTSGWISNTGVVRHGALFVDFFFVLSGFVISTGYRQRIAGGFPVVRFIGLRLGRIYPLHLFMLLCFVAWELVRAGSGGDGPAFNGSFSPANLAWSVALLNFVTVPARAKWNGPSWSIATEIWTYLLFALLFRWAGRRVAPVAAGLALASAAALALTQPTFIDAEHWGALVRCIYGFSCGVIGAELVARGRPLPLPGRIATVVEATCAALTLLFVAGAGYGPWSLLAPIVFLLDVLLFAREAGAVSRLLTRPWPLLIGTLSYSIYMVHLFVVYRTATVLKLVAHATHGRLDVSCPGGGDCVGGGVLAGDAAAVLTVVAVIALSWLTYRLVEVPGQRWSRRRLLVPARAAGEQEAPAF